MDAEVWTIVPERKGQDLPDVCNTIRREFERRNVPVRIVRANLVRNSAGKPIVLLGSEQARNLYQRLHRVRLGVLTTHEVFVRLNPTRHLLDEKWLARLSRLIRYKSYYARVTTASVATILSEFEAWVSTRHCDDERDPRVLPLHTFCPGTDCGQLQSAQGRERFEEKYGPAVRRTCEQEMVWTPDPSSHGGREPQNVAGLTLPSGLHWDVKGTRTTTRLLTLVDVWEVPRRRHVNVYPNGYVRPGHSVRRVATVRTPTSPVRKRRRK